MGNTERAFVQFLTQHYDTAVQDCHTRHPDQNNMAVKLPSTAQGVILSRAYLYVQSDIEVRMRQCSSMPNSVDRARTSTSILRKAVRSSPSEWSPVVSMSLAGVKSKTTCCRERKRTHKWRRLASRHVEDSGQMGNMTVNPRHSMKVPCHFCLYCRNRTVGTVVAVLALAFMSRVATQR